MDDIYLSSLDMDEEDPFEYYHITECLAELKKDMKKSIPIHDPEEVQHFTKALETFVSDTIGQELPVYGDLIPKNKDLKNDKNTPIPVTKNGINLIYGTRIFYKTPIM